MSDFYISLNRIPFTDASKMLTRKLAAKTGWLNQVSTRSRGGRPANTIGRVQALEAIVADIVVGTRKNKSRRFWRELSAGAFTGLPISYRSFRVAWEWLIEAGWIEIAYGATYQLTNMFDGTILANPNRTASRWKATERFFNFIDSTGLDRADAVTHFPERLPRDVIILKRTSQRYTQQNFRGRKIKYAKSKRTEELAQQVNTINHFLAEQDFGTIPFFGFRRIFFQPANLKHPKWNLGGRLYTSGPSHFQGLPKQERLKIKINGEELIELDIRASHLTIFYGVMGQKLEARLDPYNVPDIPREIVKAWIVKAFGSGQLPSRYPRDSYRSYSKLHPGRKLGNDYPVQSTGRAILNRHPILAKLPSSKLNSLALEYFESEALIGTMLELINARIPSLPVHDSLLVPLGARKKARAILTSKYEAICGNTPHLAETQGRF